MESLAPLFFPSDLKLIEVVSIHFQWPTNGTTIIDHECGVPNYDFVLVIFQLSQITLKTDGMSRQYQPFPSTSILYRRPSFPNEMEHTWWTPRLDTASWQGPPPIFLYTRMTKTSIGFQTTIASNLTNPAGGRIDADAIIFGAPSNMRYYPEPVTWQ